MSAHLSALPFSAPTDREPRPTILRHSPWDALLIGGSLMHAALLLSIPSIPLIAVGIWWNSNTIAHNLIHKPFFRSRFLNRVFALWQTALLGIPHSLWRDRHLAHHAEVRWQLRISPQLVIEVSLVLALWTTLTVMAPAFFLLTYAPAYLLGLLLCHLQGHYEHAPGTTSHYGRLYNLLFFNDGYHVEHHADMTVHWRQLPRERRPRASQSPFPAVLRWIDGLTRTFRNAAPATLNLLERAVLHMPALQHLVLHRHERAFAALLNPGESFQSVCIVGGGLYPRTALLLRRILPHAAITVIEGDSRHIEAARSFTDSAVRYHQAWYEPQTALSVDLLVLPLALKGDREAAYQQANARTLLVHDWIWRPRGRSRIISLLLLKRLNRIDQ